MIARGDPADIMRAQRPPGCFPFARVRPDKTLASDISLFHKPPLVEGFAAYAEFAGQGALLLPRAGPLPQLPGLLG